MKKILFIISTHGDEGFTVPIFEEIERKYETALYGYEWIIGNPKAFKKNVRFIDADLNRVAPGDPMSELYENRRAYEIVAMSADYDAIIDIHGSTAKCGLVKIIPRPNIANLELAKEIPLRRNVIWFSERSEVRGPLVQHVPCPAIEIECGPKDDKSVKDNLKFLIERILVANLKDEALDYFNQEYYTVYGKKLNGANLGFKDFEQAISGKEIFYPFLVNQYKELTCYKMKKLNLKNSNDLLFNN